ncbi:MAG: hypothetical protein PF448_06300 [Bacteroidales bacterium]|jgi:hypothetical protein|nr:hypothetical protein [Bacteroidales bacterium]
MVQIRNGKIYVNGDNTEIGAKFTIKEISSQYGWSYYQRKKNLNDPDFRSMLDVSNKSNLTPADVCVIYNWFGVP